jgi:hypothetical protein
MILSGIPADSAGRAAEREFQDLVVAVAIAGGYARSDISYDQAITALAIPLTDSEALLFPESLVSLDRPVDEHPCLALAALCRALDARGPRLDREFVPARDESPALSADQASRNAVATHPTVPVANAPRPAVTAAIVAWRKKTVKRFRIEHDLTPPDLAKRVTMDESQIRAIIREGPKDWDNSKCNAAAQKRLLQAIGVTDDEWYAPR